VFNAGRSSMMIAKEQGILSISILSNASTDIAELDRPQRYTPARTAKHLHGLILCRVRSAAQTTNSPLEKQSISKRNHRLPHLWHHAASAETYPHRPPRTGLHLERTWRIIIQKPEADKRLVPNDRPDDRQQVTRGVRLYNKSPSYLQSLSHDLEIIE